MTQKYQHAIKEGQKLKAGNSPTLCRTQEISQVSDALQNRRSVLLVGPPGVGKTAVLRGVAKDLKNGGNRLRSLVTAIREFSSAQFLTGTLYVGEWETKVSEIIKSAKKSRTALLITDIWNIPSAGTTSKSTNSILDALRPAMQSGDVQIIGELTGSLLESLKTTPQFLSLFEIIPIKPLHQEQIAEIVKDHAARLDMDMTPEALGRLFQLTQTFQSESKGPSPALQLVDRLKDYSEQKEKLGEGEALTPFFIEKVFSIYSGLPLFVVSPSQTKPAREIRDWFRERIIGQEAAIDAVVEAITLFKSGMRDKNRPIGTFLFVGPTGVGKTELAKALALFLFGSERRLLRFDLSEFADYNSFEMLVGKADRPGGAARLIDPVRAHPFQVVLLDELEKGHPNIRDLLLQVLDEGHLTPPIGQPVNFRNTILIATSNVGAREAGKPVIGFGAGADADRQAGRAREELETMFRLEFINRFQHLVHFHALSSDQISRIAQIELKRVLNREGIIERNLIVDIDPPVIDHVVSQGYDERYGARALKREIQRLVIMPIATLLMEQTVEAGDIIRVFVREGRIRVKILQTEESRARRREKLPIKSKDGRLFTKEELRAAVTKANKKCDALAQAAGVSVLQARIEEIDQSRRAPDFWNDTRAAGQILSRQTRLLNTVSRLESLKDQAETLIASWSRASTRRAYEYLTNDVVKFQEHLSMAERELIRLGSDNEWDALVEIAPKGPWGPARDLLVQTYANWARWRGGDAKILREPMSDDEPVLLSIGGAWAYGYLLLESGLHRVRAKEQNTAARVRVMPWTDETGPEIPMTGRAFKKQGRFGGRIRSRVELTGSDLVLQNDRNLAENRELMMDLAPSWLADAPQRSAIVRRYDLKPFLVRDFLTDSTTGRADALKPKAFHALLCARIDV